MSKITIKHLTKRFGSVVAVKEMNLEIADREFLVLLGPSGAGKTTTLRCVAGLETPEQGEVNFDDRVMQGVTPAERDVAFVFQTYALYPRKTVFQNIASPLEARKVPRSEAEARVREVARKLHIERLLERKPQQLSGGEQQRVALCRAMVRQPHVFLMDEPLTNLDFKLRVEMRAELKHLHGDLAATFFYVTNDQVEALSMADRIAVLNRGVLQQIGTPEQVYDHPVNRFVASFIGSPTMNFLKCTFSNGAEPRLNGQGWSVPLPAAARQKLEAAPNAELLLGVRAEDLTIRRQFGPGLWEAQVYVVEPLGDRNIFDLRLGVEIVRAKAAATLTADPGSRVWVEVNRDRIHLFDPKTDKAVL
jgi:multiple sugar transport system ATP-binding protein